MKIDFNKPHGVIFGHPYAAYEQNGFLYDGAGERLNSKTEETEETEETEPQRDAIKYDLQQAKDFLLGILREGPLTKTAVYKECEANNQNWEAVQQAFNDIGGETFKIRNGIFWKLKTE